MPSKTDGSIAENVMTKIKTGQLKIRPRWYFWAGSAFMLLGLVALGLFLVFLVSLLAFSLRTHGPMGAVRFQQLLDSFPWWALLTAFLGIGWGIGLLRKYDFSYRKNFLLIVSGLLFAILVSGWLVDYFGLDNLWMKSKGFQGIYQRYDGGGMGHGCGQKIQETGQGSPADSFCPRER